MTYENDVYSMLSISVLVCSMCMRLFLEAFRFPNLGLAWTRHMPQCALNFLLRIEIDPEIAGLFRDNSVADPETIARP
jgi:hypothetical protein